MTPDEWELWVAARPPSVQAAARNYPGWRNGVQCCYRSLESPRYHYTIFSYSEDYDGQVTVTLTHGSDSSLPGLGTFGQPLALLVPCNCGHWQPATAEQHAATSEHVSAIISARRRARRTQS